MPHRIHLYLILLLITVLAMNISGCTIPISSTDLPKNQRATRLYHLQDWQLSGKIAIQTTHETASAWISWTEKYDRHYTITVLDPLGIKQIQLVGQPNMVRLTTSDGHQYQAHHPEQLFARYSGWHLPLSSLYFWIRGLPASATPHHAQYDKKHRLYLLNQQGWLIYYQRYMLVNGMNLPGKLMIRSPAITVKLAINRWQVLRKN